MPTWTSLSHQQPEPEIQFEVNIIALRPILRPHKPTGGALFSSNLQVILYNYAFHWLSLDFGCRLSRYRKRH